MMNSSAAGLDQKKIVFLQLLNGFTACRAAAG
jgi:hypothetical protein